MVSLLGEEDSFEDTQLLADVATDDEAPTLPLPQPSPARRPTPEVVPEIVPEAVPAAVPALKAAAAKAAAPKAAAPKARPGRVAAATAVKTPGAPPAAQEGLGREPVPLELARGGPALEVADDRARAQAVAKAKAVPQAPHPALTPEQRKACENLRSKAYHTARKSTGDLALAALAGMKAKEDYLKSLGYEFKGTVRGPRRHVAKAKALGLAPAAADQAADLVVAPAAKKPRTVKQLQFQEQVKGAMAELRAQGAAVSIAAAMRLLRSKKEKAMATGGA